MIKTKKKKMSTRGRPYGWWFDEFITGVSEEIDKGFPDLEAIQKLVFEYCVQDNPDCSGRDFELPAIIHYAEKILNQLDEALFDENSSFDGEGEDLADHVMRRVKRKDLPIARYGVAAKSLAEAISQYRCGDQSLRIPPEDDLNFAQDFSKVTDMPRYKRERK